MIVPFPTTYISYITSTLDSARLHDYRSAAGQVLVRLDDATRLLAQVPAPNASDIASVDRVAIVRELDGLRNGLNTLPYPPHKTQWMRYVRVSIDQIALEFNSVISELQELHHVRYMGRAYIRHLQSLRLKIRDVATALNQLANALTAELEAAQGTQAQEEWETEEIAASEDILMRSIWHQGRRRGLEEATGLVERRLRTERIAESPLDPEEVDALLDALRAQMQRRNVARLPQPQQQEDRQVSGGVLVLR